MLTPPPPKASGSLLHKASPRGLPPTAVSRQKQWERPVSRRERPAGFHWPIRGGGASPLESRARCERGSSTCRSPCPPARGLGQHAGPTPDGQARRSPAPPEIPVRNLHSAEGRWACRWPGGRAELASPRTGLGLEPPARLEQGPPMGLT